MQDLDLKAKQKAEALQRMKILKLHNNVINEFKKENKLYYSEYQNKFFNAILYWVDNKKEYTQIVKEFEQEHNALVYHVQLVHTFDGDMLTILYVSPDEEEWEKDRQDLTNGEAFAWVYAPMAEEFGYVGVKPSQGGVLRTY